MKKTRVILETDMAAGGDPHDVDARSHALRTAWTGRRTIDWRMSSEELGIRTPTHPTRHEVTLATINAGERSDGTRIEFMRLAIDVETGNAEDAITKAMMVLDMPGGMDMNGEDRSYGAPSKIVGLTGSSVIGPLDTKWAVGRRITDYADDLATSADGESGLSGWQLNDGSWIVLPLPGSGREITLTTETMDMTTDRSLMSVIVDRRTAHSRAGREEAEVPPDIRTDSPVVTSFEIDATGFRLEAGDVHRTWRFEMSRRGHGSMPARTDANGSEDGGEAIAASWTITHDRHLKD